MNCIDNFLGRPVSFWQHLDHVMRKHGMENPVQLDEKLVDTKRAKRTEVYDSLNNDRLLGTLPKPEVSQPYVRMAAMTRMSVCFPPTQDDWREDVKTVGFNVGIKRGPNPLDVKGVLHTADPLKLLMQLRDFRLPGETAEQTERRRYGY